jgi:hypothetical protein
MICAIHPTPAPAITAARSCAGTDTERGRRGDDEDLAVRIASQVAQQFVTLMLNSGSRTPRACRGMCLVHDDEIRRMRNGTLRTGEIAPHLRFVKRVPSLRGLSLLMPAG